MNKLTWEQNGVYWKYSGKISGQEIIDASTAVYGDSRFDDLRYKLADFLDAETIEMSDDELMVLAFQHRASERANSNIKNAIVVRPEFNELAKHFVSFFDDSSWLVKVFHEREEANNWLARESTTL